MKSFSKTASSVYAQYEKFYNENTTITIASAVVTVGAMTVAAVVAPPIAFAMIATLVIAGAGHFIADMFNFFVPTDTGAAASATASEEEPAANAKALDEDPTNDNSHAKMAKILGTPESSRAASPAPEATTPSAAATPQRSRSQSPVITAGEPEPQVDERSNSAMSNNM